jgi:hypothetical protein
MKQFLDKITLTQKKGAEAVKIYPISSVLALTKKYEVAGERVREAGDQKASIRV